MGWAALWTIFAAVSNWFRIKCKVYHRVIYFEGSILLSLFLFVSLDAVVGPGPHKIENGEEEPEPDFNLLPQRDAPAPPDQ